MLNLDTHILLFALEGKLTAHEKAILATAHWGISAIVLWEITKLHQKRKIALGLESPPLLRALGRIQIWPITIEVCLNLSALDFSSDPADELIASTSLTYNVPLVTRDDRIRTSKILKLA
jgi:PIN domain nuclease of toxin-antitoxin system